MEEIEFETLGEAVKRYRHAAGFTSADKLAEAIGGSPSAAMISHVESGRRNFGADALDNVIAALGLSPDEAAYLHNLRKAERDGTGPRGPDDSPAGPAAVLPADYEIAAKSGAELPPEDQQIIIDLVHSLRRKNGLE